MGGEHIRQSGPQNKTIAGQLTFRRRPCGGLIAPFYIAFLRYGLLTKAIAENGKDYRQLISCVVLESIANLQQ